jgi:hypothetical protein
MAITTRQAQLIYAQEVEKQLFFYGPLFRAFSRNFSADAANIGDTIKVPFVQQNTAAAWNDTSNNYATGETNQGQFEILINKRMKTSFSITQKMLMEMRVDEWREKAAMNVASVVNAIFADLTALIVVGNFPKSQVLTAATTTLDKIAELRTYAATNKIPPSQAALVLNSTLYSTLLAKLPYHVFGDQNPIKTGSVPGILGFANVIEIPQMTMPGFICLQSALAVALRAVPVLDATPYGLRSIIQDETSGLFVTRTVFTNGPVGTTTDTVESAYGVAAGEIGRAHV